MSEVEKPDAFQKDVFCGYTYCMYCGRPVKEIIHEHQDYLCKLLKEHAKYTDRWP